MKVLGFCATSYQFLVFNRIIEQYYPSEEVSIIISDTISDAGRLVKNAKKENKYKEVSLWNIKEKYQYLKWKRLLFATLGWFSSKIILNGHDEINNNYDVYLFSNLGLPMLYLGYVLKHNNPKIICGMFEDGFNTYSENYGNFLTRNRLSDRITRRFFKRINYLFLFNPKILGWESSYVIKKLDPIFEGELLDRINRVFNYELLNDDYNKKIIFFEESYFADGKEIDDIEIIEAITSTIAKKEIFVKIHPRNCVNRFAKRGYISNRNVNIPWEVVVLNQNFDNSVFITLASNAAMNPFFLFGKTTPVVLLFKCTKKPESLTKSIIEFDEKLCGKYPQIFYIPNNYNEMLTTIRALIKGDRV